jgi:hypothetical protein
MKSTPLIRHPAVLKNISTNLGIFAINKGCKQKQVKLTMMASLLIIKRDGVGLISVLGVNHHRAGCRRDS